MTREEQASIASAEATLGHPERRDPLKDAVLKVLAKRCDFCGGPTGALLFVQGKCACLGCHERLMADATRDTGGVLLLAEAVCD